MNKLRIATRKSQLAMAQANWVKQQLKLINIDAELIGISTSGDQNTTTSLQEHGGKNVFIKELQIALLNNDADIAVHSIKDMSVYPYQDLTIAAICERESADDVLITINHKEKDMIIGTTSPRRQSQMLALDPTCTIKLCRGNINSRIQQLTDNKFDGIILAKAGLNRLGITDITYKTLPHAQFTPAIGQGAIGIECLSNKHELQTILAPLNHTPTATCVKAERTVNTILNGDCFAAVAAHAHISQNKLKLQAMVGNLNGTKIIRASGIGDPLHHQQIGESVANKLIDQGALTILQENRQQ